MKKTPQFNQAYGTLECKYKIRIAPIQHNVIMCSPSYAKLYGTHLTSIVSGVFIVYNMVILNFSITRS